MSAISNNNTIASVTSPVSVASSSPICHTPLPISFFAKPTPARLAEIHASFPPPSLQIFLQSVKRYLNTPSACAAAASAAGVTQLRFHVIMGNEASDADSMICALVLAWYLTILHPPQTGNIFIPICNITREELPLRQDARYPIHSVGLDTALLIFTDEIDLRSLAAGAASNAQSSSSSSSSSSSPSLGVILVDHNRLATSQEALLGPFVEGILDHHKDEQLYSRTVAPDNKILAVTGSCTSLLGEMIYDNVPALFSKESFPAEIDHSVAHCLPAPLAVLTLLYHVLLLDNNDMSPVTKKYREPDVKMHKIYHECIQHCLYHELIQRRADISQLTSSQLLHKDAKYGENQRYPHLIASIPGSLHSWYERDKQFIQVIEKTTREKQLRFIVCLLSHTTKGSGKYLREIVIVVPKDSSTTAAAAAASTSSSSGSSASSSAGILDSSSLFRALCSSFEGATTDLNVTELTPLQIPAELARIAADSCSSSSASSCFVKLYSQRNLSSSRKQVAPLVEGLLSKL